MRVSRPISVLLPDYGVLFAESAHAADFRMAERRDPYHKLIYVLEGQVGYWEEGLAPETATAEAGALLVVPSAARHRLADIRPSTLLLLCLSGEFLGSHPDLACLWLAVARTPGHRLRLSRPARQRLEAAWRGGLAETGHERLGRGAAVRALAAQALVLLARLPAEDGGATAPQRVAAVRREIEETFFEPWDLDRAACRAGLSRRRFTELFRVEAGGRTFWSFLNDRRLEHAARLLRGGGNSVLGVMFACGFNDLAHFYRQFRRRFGAPPKRWLNEERTFSL